jgi:hypothetical protein
MPALLSNVAIQQFHDTFTNAYQAASQLADTCQLVSGARGSAYNWPLQGDAAMELRNAYQSLIPVASNDYAQTQTTFENYILNLPVDIFQQAELIIDTLSQLGVVHAKAAGRREDQFLLNAQYAAGNAFLNPITNPPPQGNKLPDQEPPGLVPANFGSNPAIATAVNLNVAKIIRAAIIMDQNNVPHEDRYLVVNAAMIGALMSDGEKPTNILYNNTKTLMQGGVDTFMGFKIITLGNRSEGGIQLRPPSGQTPALPDPIATANATAIAWHKNSLGAVYALNPITEVEWSPTHQSWLTISRLRMGASNLLGHGVVFIDCLDTAGPTAP